MSCESHLVWLVFCGSQPYMFLHFCEMLFLELVSGDFLGEAGLFGITFFVNELQGFTCNFFLLLFGGKRDHLLWFC